MVVSDVSFYPTSINPSDYTNPIGGCVTSRDRPERDSARAPASLSGRISCRSRSKINSKILLLTGAQDLLPGQDLLLEQKLLLEQEHM